MATSMPNALLATDSEKDAALSNQGTSSHLPDIADLCHMFDKHIEQLGKMKETTLRNDQEVRSKVTRLEQEKRDRDEKIARLEQENLALKENHPVAGGVTPPNKNPTLPDTAEHWRVKCEDMGKKIQKLQEELSVHRSRKNEAAVCSICRGSADPPLTNNEGEILVDMEHKLYLSENIPGNNFKRVLRHLSVPDTEVTNIYDTIRDPKECCIEGLIVWKRDKGQKANVWALLQGLLKSRFRDVAEDFCKTFKLHQLLTKIGQADDPVSSSEPPLAPEREIDKDPNDLGADFTDAPPTPPACPPDARPLHAMLWPHLRPPPSLEDLDTLDQDLHACEPFTTQQLEKLAKRLPNETPKEEFLTACGTGNASAVLNEWTSRKFPSATIQDASSVLKLGKMLRKLERHDIRKVLTSLLKMGVIGPSMEEKIYIRKLCHNTFHKIGRALSEPQANGMHDWRCLASDTKHSEHIGLLSKKELPGCEVLRMWNTSNDATVGKLYEWALKEFRWDIAKIMESDMSNNGI